MHFTYIIALCSLFLFSAVVAAPVPGADASLIVTLDRRTVTPTFTFTGDLASITISPNVPANSPKRNRQTAREALQKAASTRVAAVLSAASTPLELSGNLAVTIVNNFHTSKDPESHATFKFSATICGGTCVGHAYNPVSTLTPGRGQPGKIFNAAGAGIFGETDVVA